MITIITTVDNRETLEGMGRELLAKRLVACMQIIGPIKSIYRWKGRLEEAEEWMGLMKTQESLYEEVEKEIRRLHPYEVPEIAAVDSRRVLPAYAQWVVDETTTAPAAIKE